MTLATTSSAAIAPPWTAGLPDTVHPRQAGGVHLASRHHRRDDPGLRVLPQLRDDDQHRRVRRGELRRPACRPSFTLIDDEFSHNRVVSVTLPGSSGTAQGDSGGGEVSGTITGTRFIGNTVAVRSVAGDVNAWAGAAIFSGTMTRSLVEGNRVLAAAPRVERSPWTGRVCRAATSMSRCKART